MQDKIEWYRFEDHLVSAGVDEWDNSLGSYVEVYMYRYPLIKLTPRGAWVDLGCGDKRFVLNDARKKFACPTIPEAFESFKARKERQISILLARKNNAERAIERAAELIRRNHFKT